MQKRIVMLSNLDIWSIDEGKGAPSFYNTIKAYVDDNWDITLIQPDSKYRKKYKVKGCKIVTFKNTFFDFLNRIPKIRFFSRFFSHIYATHQFQKIANQIIKDKKKAVIYAYEVFAVKAAKKISKKYKLPLVTRFQGTILIKYKNTIINRIYKYPHYSALSETSDLIIMTDDGTKGDIVLKNLNNKTKKILFWKNGQDEIKPLEQIKEANLELRKKHNIDKNCTVLLTVSRLKNWKKVDRAIYTLSELKKQNKNVKLIIVGDGEEYDNLVQLSKQLNVQDSIIFTGSIKQEDVWKYYSCSDIFLSLYDISNVGNPLMEAMRYGKAIITINNGNTNEIIKNNLNGILLPSNFTINKIVEKAIKLMEDEKIRKALGKNAKEYSEKILWTWKERMQAEVIEILKIFNNSCY